MLRTNTVYFIQEKTRELPRGDGEARWESGSVVCEGYLV